ncbi:MAG: hypothetical protein RMI34_06855 [Chloroherpetonaceae bacterium]|nr:hypothetical protein [Chloroherpetonaceae bacterium]MCS7212210.1 hypothetical protein [Chloroherpetonaceae bacterium]MDW8019777.1 hypothetical protein [Chloroherpetonaceae bacterium]MDW8465271.1 hypothetical protein [Chloroherpetonaceae bacterium]
MNLLDENIPEPEAQKLRRFKIRIRQIGKDIAVLGDDDLQKIIPLLHQRGNITFFTADRDFYKAELRHQRYCLVYLDVAQSEEATYIRRFLRHKQFRQLRQRLGKVVRLSPDGIHFWTLGSDQRNFETW